MVYSQGDKQVNVVIVRRFVRSYLAALVAFMRYNIALFAVGADGNGAHYAAALGKSVAGAYVKV